MKLLKDIKYWILGPSETERVAMGIQKGIEIRASFRKLEKQKPRYKPSVELINLLNSK